MHAAVFVIAVIAVGTLTSAARSDDIIKIAVVIDYNKSRPFVRNRTEPAIQLAVEKITAPNGYLPGRNITVVYGNSQCASPEAMNIAIQLYKSDTSNERASLFLGPACSFALAPIARQAKFWKVPIITLSLALDFQLSKKTDYPTLTSMGVNLLELGDAIDALLTRYSWKKMKMLYLAESGVNMPKEFHLIADGIDNYFVKKGLQITYQKYERGKRIADNLKKDVGIDNATTLGVLKRSFEYP